jgi:ABC-2 type transport system permease protein
MNRLIIRTLILKDLKLFFSNQFFALVTFLGLFAYIGIFYLMPASVDEELDLGLYIPEIPAMLQDFIEKEEISFVQFDSDEALQDAILAGDLPAGYSFPEGSMEALMLGEDAQVNLYFSSDIPEEFKEVYKLVLDDFGFLLSDTMVDIEVTEVVFGPDMAGEQIAPRHRMLPLMAIFVLMIETLGIASLISAELVGGTLRALLVTPLTVVGLFAGKGIFGTLFAFVQAAVLMAFTGGLSNAPLLILTVLLLGSMLVTGIGFLMASVSRDLLTVMAWGILVILVLAIPSFVLLIPGIASDWIKLIPSYYLVDTVYRVINFDAGWSDVVFNLLALLGFSLVFMVLGVYALRRKLR